jgi:hypothetical protein
MAPEPPANRAGIAGIDLHVAQFRNQKRGMKLAPAGDSASFPAGNF